MKVHFGAGFCNDDTGEYYVYTHSVEGYGVFYVGKGCKSRIGDNTGRNLDWLKVADKFGVENIKRTKVYEHLTEAESLLKEYELIQKELEKSSPLVNKNTTSVGGHLSLETRERMRQLNTGLNNPCADQEIHHFIHKDGGEFIGTRVEFAEKYKFAPHVLFKPKSKLSYKTHNGWTLKGREFYNQEGENSRVSDKKTYLFRNDDGREFVGLRTAFSKEFNIQSKRLFGKRAMKVYFGWRVIECLDKE
jgi:hypothetical protein